MPELPTGESEHKNPHEPVWSSAPQPRPSKISRSPDASTFLAFFGILITICIFLLQADGVEITWEVSAVTFFILVACMIWIYLFFLVPHFGNSVKIFGSVIIIGFIGVLGIYGTARLYETQHSQPISPPTDNDAKKALKNLEELTVALSENLTNVPLAALTARQQDYSNDERGLQTEHEILASEPTTFENLREDRTNHERQVLVKQQQEKIQQTIDDVQNKIAAQQAKQLEELNKEKDEKQRKKYTCTFALPIFEYAIKSLDGKLADISKESGEPRFSDFSGQFISIYDSRMESDELILTGTNFLSLGKNTFWKFEISTTAGDQTYYEMEMPHPFYSARFKILSHSTNGDLTLTIGPKVGIYAAPKILQPAPYENWHGLFFIRLTVPNGEATGLDMLEDIQPGNFAVIDEAVKRLLEAQDKESKISN